MKRFLKENWRWLVSLVLIIVACILYLTNPEIYREHRVIFYSSAVFSILTLIYLPCLGYYHSVGIGEMFWVAVYFLAITIMWKYPISFYWSFIPFIVISIAMTWRLNASDSENYAGAAVMAIFIVLALSFAVRADRQEEEYIAQATPEVVQLTYVNKNCNRVYIEGKGIFDVDVKGSPNIKTGDVVKVITYEGRIVQLQDCTSEELQKATATETLTVNFIDRNPIGTIAILAGKGALKVRRGVSTDGIEPQDNVNVKIYKGEIISLTKI